MCRGERLGRAGDTAVMGPRQPPVFLGSLHVSGVRIVSSSLQHGWELLRTVLVDLFHEQSCERKLIASGKTFRGSYTCLYAFKVHVLAFNEILPFQSGLGQGDAVCCTHLPCVALSGKHLFRSSSYREIHINGKVTVHPDTAACCLYFPQFLSGSG